MKKVKPLHETQSDPYPELSEHSRRIAAEVIKDINATVPLSVPNMRYARQCVLEKVIEALQASV